MTSSGRPVRISHQENCGVCHQMRPGKRACGREDCPRIPQVELRPKYLESRLGSAVRIWKNETGDRRFAVVVSDGQVLFEFIRGKEHFSVLLEPGETAALLDWLKDG